MNKTVPREIALELCQQIRKENKRKWFGAGKMQCSFCYRLAKDDPSRLCVFATETNRGCSQVSERYEKLYEQ